MLKKLPIYEEEFNSFSIFISLYKKAGKKA